MKTAEEILDKHWIEYRTSCGLEYEPMTPRSKECFLNAMNENKNIFIDWSMLRDEYFIQCVEDGKIIYAPHDLFEWFKSQILK